MSDLHWTGAALLLALAISDGPVRDPRLSGAGQTRATAAQAGAAVRPSSEAEQRRGPTAADPRHSRPDAARRQARGSYPTHGDAHWVRAAAVCGHCGREAGELEWNAAREGRLAVLHVAGAALTRLVDLDRTMRCGHCHGPVFVEEPRLVSSQPPVELAAWGGVVAPRRVG